MNFLRSVFSDSPPQSPTSPNPNPTSSSSSAAWNLTSLLDSYSRDLADFSSALRHDTSLISRSILPLPLSIDDAQHSLESVGQAIDDLGSLLLSRGKLAFSSLDHPSSAPGVISGVEKYNRYSEQLSAIQGNTSTYLDDPDDLAEFTEWKLGFVLEDRREEIERLVCGDGVVRGIYERIVPSEVEREVFWGRYFYRVYKLDKVEDARVRLVRRAMAGEDEEEELRWDFEDDGVDDDKLGSGKTPDRKRDGGQPSTSEAVDSSHGNSEEKEAKVAVKDSGGDSSCKDSDLSIISSQPSMPEVEDLGWDEIEDVIENSEKNRIKQAEGASRTSNDELRKRLSTTAEDDDLSWDIEEEDDMPGN